MPDTAPPSAAGLPGRITSGRVIRLDAPAQGPRRARRPGVRQRLAGAGLPVGRARFVQLARSCAGAQVLAFGCGLVGADYVEAAYFSLILPALSGLACGWLLSRGAPLVTSRLLTPLAMVYGAASAAIAFVYASTPYGSAGTWLPPLLCGCAGAIAWPYVDPSPRR